ncbi:ABC transporter ATP-binding protein [Herbaspirillum sp. CAH-3]|uniref:ABC transporter ATP-binding protein n=1 Tax=Herbaspirillum sp. CAH-3 TaxID=2605746 RepID=UPI0012ACD18B|nr:ABC transporter ATP-binding protein [Herbaspirillum sp. CAH-3]
MQATPLPPSDAAPPEAASVSAARAAPAPGVVSRLLALTRTRPGPLLIATLAGIAAAILSLTPNLVAYQFSLALLHASLDQDRLIALVGWLIGGTLAGRLCFLASQVSSHLMAADIQTELRRQLLSRLVNVPLGFFQDHSSQKIRQVVIDDVEQLEDGLAHLIPELTSHFIAPLIVIAGLFAVDWRLSLASLSSLVLGMVACMLLMRKRHDIAQDFYLNQGKLFKAMTEILRTMPAARLFNSGAAMQDRVEEANGDYVGTAHRWVRGALLPNLVMQVLVSSPLLLLLPLGLWWHQQGSLDLATLCFFVFFTPGLGNLLTKLAGFSNRFVQQQQAFEHLDMLLGAPEQSEGSHTSLPEKITIRCEQVSFSYHQQAVLDNLSLTLHPGTTTALVGGSGSGKSTLVKLLLRHWDVTSGRILLGERPINDYTREALRQNITCIFQENQLFDMSIADNIRLGKPAATEEEVIQAARAAQAHEFIMALPQGYQTVLAQGSTLLSGGEQQRLAIARAILKNAPILLLDEATSQADALNEHRIQLALSALAADKTVLVIAHRLSSIAHADQIIVLEQGHVVEQGPHAALLQQQGRYASLWRMQHAHDITPAQPTSEPSSPALS